MTPGEYHRLRVNGGEERVTVLLHMRRVEGGIAFARPCGTRP